MTMSRRSFMKAAAGTAAAAAVMSTGASFAAAEEMPAEEKSFAVAPVMESEAGAPAMECDYLVIGAGNCGMMSAAHAAALGMSVIVLEKAAVTGGSSIGTEVTMAFSDCKIMQECTSDPNVINVSQQTGSNKEIFNYFMMHNSWAFNANLVTNFIQNNHRYHDFLYENGAYPMMLLPSLDAPTGGIMYQGQGIGAFNVMQDIAVKNGAEIYTESPAKKLVVSEAGAVVGAIAEIAGEESFVKAKAVFVGTGGFSCNEEMVAHYIPGYGPMAYKNDWILCHDGDGICMMLGVGAAESDMGLAQPAGSSVAGAPWETAVDKASREPYLWVNRTGERVNNEKWNVMDTTFKICKYSIGHTAFNIVDSAALARMEQQPFVTGARTVLGSMDPYEGLVDEIEEAVAEGIVLKADTIEELAEAAGIDPAGLAATVANYNAMCEAGEDTQFYKEAEYMIPIAEAPFYAFEMIPSWYSTLNGVKVNGNLEVVDEMGKVIPGLYAGGLDSGEFFKDDYNHGFSGSCSGYSYFTGYYAAEMAQKYIEA